MNKVIKRFEDGILLKNEKGYFFNDVDGNSEIYSSKDQAIEEYYIKQAISYHGSAVRDNSRKELINIGKSIDKGIDL